MKTLKKGERRELYPVEKCMLIMLGGIIFMWIALTISTNIHEKENQKIKIKQQIEAVNQTPSECETYDKLKESFNINIDKRNPEMYKVKINTILVSPQGLELKDPLNIKVDTETELKDELIKLGYLCK